MADKKKDSDDDVLEMRGYRESTLLKTLTWTGVILTAGILRFVFYLFPVWYLKATHSKTTLAYAQKLLVTDIYEKRRTLFICSVKIINLTSLRLSCQNVSFQDSNESNRFIDEQFEDILQSGTVVYFQDGSYQVLEDSLRITHIKKLPYVWDEEKRNFRKLAGVGPGLNHQDLHHYPEYSEFQRNVMRTAYGDNVLDVPDTPFLVIVLKETFSAFYVFQFGVSFLWIVTGGWVYTLLICVLTILIILATSAFTKQNQIKLKRTVTREQRDFKVLLGSGIQPVNGSGLVPGDRILLPKDGCTVPCDGIILNGCCVVNESMLTGESVPQMKTALPVNNADYVEKDSTDHYLYSGTNLLRCDGSEPLQLLVTRTGFSTSHGSIVRSILYPRPLDFAFENSVIKFATTVFSISLIGAVINAIIEIVHKEDGWTIARNTINIAIMLIPPIMPIITTSRMIGMRRLLRKKIYCINAAALNLAGSATVTCFDKTGTLTEDGLDLYAVVPTKSAMFSEAMIGNSPSSHETEPGDLLTLAMATCHSLITLNNQLAGDPIDIQMFQWTNWEFNMADDKERSFTTVSPKDNKFASMEIVHRNQFSSTLQRMSVVVRSCNKTERKQEPFRLFCKGSPEMIASLSLPHTVPSNMMATLESYTRRGFRVLALGTRVLHEEFHVLQRAPREKIEHQLEFLGIIAFENKLKKQTNAAIQELKNANYKIIMITGDNQQTAECVAKECEIITKNQTIIEFSEKDLLLKCNINRTISTQMAESAVSMENGGVTGDYVFSINGKAWPILKELHRDVLPKILAKSAVFARMSSDQKKEVINELSALGYGTVMCGDGANDCGALRSADVGISLSQSESSAAASFISHVEDISCVPHVIRYGRCSLATSISFFKYMTMTSILITLVQRIMEAMDSKLSDGELIYLNMISNINFSIWFPRPDANPGPLPPRLPPNSVLKFPVLFSLISNLIVFFVFLLTNYFLVKQFSWYTVPNDQMSYESYAMFCTVTFQIVILAISQSPGFPFREPLRRNYMLVLAITIVFILDVFVTVHPSKTFTDWLQIPFPPKLDFPLTLIALLVCNFIFIMLLEWILVNRVIDKRCQQYPYLFKIKTRQKSQDIQDNGYKWVIKTFMRCPETDL